MVAVADPRRPAAGDPALGLHQPSQDRPRAAPARPDADAGREPRAARPARSAPRGAAVAERLATLRAAVADQSCSGASSARCRRAAPAAAKAVAEAERVERALRDGPDALAADDGLRLLSSRSALAVLHREVVAGRAHSSWGQADADAGDDPTRARWRRGRTRARAGGWRAAGREPATESL